MDRQRASVPAERMIAEIVQSGVLAWRGVVVATGVTFCADAAVLMPPVIRLELGKVV